MSWHGVDEEAHALDTYIWALVEEIHHCRVRIDHGTKHFARSHTIKGQSISGMCVVGYISHKL